MKVSVHDMQPISPAVGGGRIRLLGLFHALGMETTYVGTYDWPGESPRDQWLTSTLREVTVPLSQEHFIAAASLSQRAGGKVVIDSAFHQLGYLSPAYVARAIDEIQQADIVIFEHPWVYPLVAHAIDRSRQLLVYDSQNVEGFLRISMLDDGGVGTEVASEVILIERDLCRAAHLVLACSHEDRVLFHDLYGIPYQRVKLCPNGVFTKTLRPATDVERAQSKQKLEILHAHAAVFIGSGYQFNMEAAQFIIDSLAPEFPSVLFVICGSVGAALPAHYRSHIRSNVRFTGTLSDEDKYLYFKACDVALNPMFGGSGTNIKMFDYMSAGLPVVSTAIGARGILALPSPAFVVAAPKQFAASLRTLLGRRSYWQTVSRNARHLACTFYSWEHISPALGHLLAHQRDQLGGPHPTVSLIAVIKHGADRTDALRQFQSACSPEVEVIVIDQGSQPLAHDHGSESSPCLYIHTDLQETAAIVNLGAFLAQGEVLVFSGEQLEPQWLNRVHAVLEAPDVAAATGSTSLSDLDSRDLIIRQEFLNSTEGFLPGSRPDTVRIKAQWERQCAEGHVVFKGTPTTKSVPTNVAEWVGLTPREFVERAAAEILGKHADRRDLAALTRLVELGECEKIMVLQELLHLRARSGLSCGKVVPLIPEAFSDDKTYLYSLEELLEYYDEMFVKNVYRLLLRRDPDPSDLSSNLCALKVGGTTREAIIRNILGSEEALQIGVRVIGINAHIPQGTDPGDLFSSDARSGLPSRLSGSRWRAGCHLVP